VGVLVFESLFPVLLIIGIGFGLRRSSIVPQEHWEGIELLGYWLLIPVLVFVSLVKMDLSNIPLGSITKAYLLAIIAQFIIVWFLRKPLHRYLHINNRSFSSIFQVATRWNGFIALAIADNFAGDQGLAIVALIIAVTIPVLNITNVTVLTVCCSDTRPTVKMTVINSLKVPLIWGAILGLSINLIHLPIYEPLMVSLDVVGRAGLGIGLLTVGAGLHARAMLNARSTVLIGIVLKLLVFPILVFVGCFICGVHGLPLHIAVLCASVPTATNGYVLARQMGGDAELYATTASLQVVVSMLSTPFILWLVSGVA
jgi:malonate transporter